MLVASTVDRTQHKGRGLVIMLPRWTIAEEGQTEHHAVRVRFGPSVSPRTL